jgi:hypothetical protein
VKLTQIQIDQIIEGLENPNTRLESIHIGHGEITNVITKLKNGKYRNTLPKKFRGFFNRCDTRFKSDIIKTLESSEHFTFELVTKVYTETITKI